MALLVWLWRSPRSRKTAPGLDERSAQWLALATLAGLVALFALVHPLAQSGRYGPGSDSGDALNRATHALLRGEFPYREKTFLGNPITPMPGELLLAAPFVLLGDGAWQVFLWLALAFLLLRRALGSTARALSLTWLLLLASPAVLHHLLTGSDYAASALAVLVLALLLTERRDAPAWQGAILAALLGLAVSSRAIFFLVLPLIAGRLIAASRARGAALGGLAALAACAATLPFYLHDRAGFSPLQSAQKLWPLESILPHATWLVPLAGALLSLFLAQPRLNRSSAAFLRSATLALAFTLLVPAILWTAIGAPRLQYTSYCELGLYFGLSWCAAQGESEMPA